MMLRFNTDYGDQEEEHHSNIGVEYCYGRCVDEGIANDITVILFCGGSTVGGRRSAASWWRLWADQHPECVRYLMRPVS